MREERSEGAAPGDRRRAIQIDELISGAPDDNVMIAVTQPRARPNARVAWIAAALSLPVAAALSVPATRYFRARHPIRLFRGSKFAAADKPSCIVRAVGRWPAAGVRRHRRRCAEALVTAARSDSPAARGHRSRQLSVLEA